jgi:single-strand DNA-binding protein
MSVRSLNKVLLIGNLTRDPNLRYTPNGTAVCSFGLATNRTWAPADGGEKQEKVEYHNIVAWSKLADICGQLLHKGDKVFVEGRIQTRDWKGDDGQERKITEIVIDNMMLLSSGRGGSGRSFGGDDMDMNASDDMGSAPAPSKSKKSKAAAADEDVTDDDITSVEDVADDIPF